MIGCYTRSAFSSRVRGEEVTESAKLTPLCNMLLSNPKNEKLIWKTASCRANGCTNIYLLCLPQQVINWSIYCATNAYLSTRIQCEEALLVKPGLIFCQFSRGLGGMARQNTVSASVFSTVSSHPRLLLQGTIEGYDRIPSCSLDTHQTEMAFYRGRDG